MARNKRQHYLGQSYLRGFADRQRKDAIWQFRKSTNEIRLRGIHKVAQIPYYYSTEDQSGNRDHSIERWFATIESWWPSLIEKINSNSSRYPSGTRRMRISDQDRVRILQFMLIHLLRVPRYMEWMRRYVQEYHPRRSNLTERETRNLRVMGLEHTHDFMVKQWIGFLDARELTTEAVPAGSRISLFTCDNPVIISNPDGADGIAYDTTHVLFPVSRRLFIRWAGPRTMQDAIMVKVHHDRELVDGLNRHLIMTATDEVYSSNPHHVNNVLSDMGVKPTLRCPTG